MSWIPALVLIIAAGFVVAWRLPVDSRLLPRILRAFGLAMLFGPGTVSIGYFLLLFVGLGSPSLSWAVTGIAFAAAIAIWKSMPTSSQPAGPSKFPLLWLLGVILTLSLVVFVLDFSTANAANPNGEWDASAIWNLRAKFLAAGPDLWRRAIASEPGTFMNEASHPAYPLFLSSFVGLLWHISGNSAAEVPATVSLLVALAVLALLIAGLARRSLTLGILAGSLLLGTELFAWQAPFQYADLLVALCFLSALTLLDSATMSAELIAAGFAIGLAPWIKNEGQPFAIAALCVAVWRFRGKAGWVVLGTIPGILATSILKLSTGGGEPTFPPLNQAVAKLADPSRWVQSLGGFAQAIGSAGPWWAHPVILAAAVAAVVGFAPNAKRVWLAIPIAITFAAELGVYLVTTSDLTWQISTSATRLVMQLWPAVLWLLFSALRPPEEYSGTASTVESPKAKRKHS